VETESWSQAWARSLNLQVIVFRLIAIVISFLDELVNLPTPSDLFGISYCFCLGMAYIFFFFRFCMSYSSLCAEGCILSLTVAYLDLFS